MILSAEHIIFSKKTLLFMHLMHRHKYMYFKNEIKPDKKILNTTNVFTPYGTPMLV